MNKFIVAEITKNWTNQTPATELLSQKLEMVINTNDARGYKLVDWKISQVIYGNVFTETIIAIFQAKEWLPIDKEKLPADGPYWVYTSEDKVIMSHLHGGFFQYMAGNFILNATHYSPILPPQPPIK